MCTIIEFNINFILHCIELLVWCGIVMESEMCMKSLGFHSMWDHFSILVHDHIEIHAVLVPGKGKAGGYMIGVMVVHCCA